MKAIIETLKALSDKNQLELLEKVKNKENITQNERYFNKKNY